MDRKIEQWRSLMRGGAAAMLVLACGACAMFREPVRPVPGFDLVVVNDVQPAVPVLVYLVDPGGTRLRAGAVDGGSRTVLHLPSNPVNGDHMLLATDNSGHEVVSQRVTLSTGENRLIWQLAERYATTERSR